MRTSKTENQAVDSWLRAARGGFVSALIYMLGCAQIQPISSADMNLGAGGHSREIPLRAGLLLDQTFRDSSPVTCCDSFGQAMAVSWIVVRREALVAGSTSMLESIFPQVTIIESTDEDRGLDVIVRPAIVEMYDDFANAMDFGNRVFKMEMTVVWNIASPVGRQIFTTKVSAGQ